jgi:hypothetical protein
MAATIAEVELRRRHARSRTASSSRPALEVDRFVPGHGRVATVEDVRALREHLRAFLADPESIESLYPGWDFWGDTADRNRAFLRQRRVS